jgi:hypothetical protein
MPMNYSDDEIRGALELSIEKWKKNTKVQRKSQARIKAESCPLCAMFANTNDEDTLLDELCNGCPVKARTGIYGCQGTPWEKARDQYHDKLASVQDFHKAAQAEVEFLESLRTPT